MMRALCLFAAATVALPLAGCAPSDAPPAARTGKLVVATSIGPQAWLAQQIGGPRVEAFSVLAPGESPHTYQPTDAEVSRVMQADVYFRIGISFENGPWFKALRASQGVPVVDVRRGVPVRDMEAHSDHEEGEHAAEGSTDGAAAHDHDADHAEHGADHAEHDDVEGDDHGIDPHIWLSPQLLKVQGYTMLEAMSEHAPADAAEFKRNFESLEKRLDEADAALRQKLAPLAGKAFFVFHPAWGYFADTYGLKQVAIESQGKEPSDRELTLLQEQARQQGIRVIFVQPQISGRSAEAVAEAIGGRVEILDPLSDDVIANLLAAADALVASHGAAPATR